MKIEFDLDNAADRRRVKALIGTYEATDGAETAARETGTKYPIPPDGTTFSEADIVLRRLKYSETGKKFLVPFVEAFDGVAPILASQVADELKLTTGAVASYIRTLGKYFGDHPELPRTDVFNTHGTEPKTYSVPKGLKERLAKL